MINKHFDPIDIVFITLIGSYLLIIFLIITMYVIKVLITPSPKKIKKRKPQEHKVISVKENVKKQKPQEHKVVKVKENVKKQKPQEHKVVKVKNNPNIKKEKLNDKKKINNKPVNKNKPKKNNPPVKYKNNSTKRSNGYVSPTKRKKKKRK